MSKKLLLWGCPLAHLDSLKSKGMPTDVLGDIGISETFNPKKTHPDFDFPWVSLYFNKPIADMPEEVVVCLKKVKSVAFDLLNYTDFYLVSEPLLNYFTRHGLRVNGGMSKVQIVNVKGESLTDEIFYLLRHINFNSESEVEWVRDEDSEIVDVTTESEKDIFLLQLEDLLEAKDLAVDGCVLVSAELRKEIEQKFKNPMLYTVEEWRELNADDWPF